MLFRYSAENKNNRASVTLGTCETKRVARNTGNVASLVASMTVVIFWSFLAVLMENIYDFSDRITILSTDTAMSKLVVKLINGLK